MKVVGITTTILLLLESSIVSPLSIRSAKYGRAAVVRREAEAESEVLHAPLTEHFDEGLLSYLEKRRGGGGSSGGGSSGGGSSGGGGGGGGGGGRGGSSGSSSSGSSSSGSSGSSSGSGRSGSSGSSGGSRNTGSASSSSSARPAYGGGRYYGGGSTTPYRSGGRSPGGILPFALGGAALGIFPGLWLYGAYAYPYSHNYNFRNRTDNRNESLPVTCLCDKYSACGCDDNNNSTFLDSVVANGSSASDNNTLYRIGNVNGTKTLILNGTLPNGTDTENGTDNSTPSSSGVSRNYVAENAGFWLVGAIVGATIWLV